jgi:hypothetical protein
MYGISIIIRNEDEFNRVKEFLGKEILYLDFVPQMETTETGIIIYFSDPKFLSIGSVGSTDYQKKYNIRLVEFSEFFKQDKSEDEYAMKFHNWCNELTVDKNPNCFVEVSTRFHQIKPTGALLQIFKKQF